MSASDDFPRGWIVQSETDGSQPPNSITIPAVPFVAHVLTDIEAFINFLNASTGTVYLPEIHVNGKTYLGLQYNDNVAGYSGYFSGRDSETWSGKLILPVNTALTVEFSYAGGGTSMQCGLVIQGYDI